MKMEYKYEPIRDGGTFKLDKTTATAIKADMESILGKVVSLVGTTAPEVGYGTSGDPVFGVVTAVEKEAPNSEDFVVTVEYGRCFEEVPTSGTSTAVAGKGVAVNGAGAVITSEDITTAICLAVNGTTDCIIRVF